MSLLQIVEPGEQQAQTAGRKIAIGIDLGTTNTLVATVRDGVAEVLLDENNKPNIPSVILYRDSEPPQIGYEAAEMMLVDPGNVLVSIKRLMGRGPEEVARFAGLFGYQVLDSSSRVPQIQTVAGAKTAIEISADLLCECKKRVQSVLDVNAIDGAVITVPAYFNDAQRQATRDAARIAGIDVYRLINEPTAAAVAYGLDRAEDGETIAVFDLGGGTFDISLLRLEKGVMQVIAIGGDSLLGGDDFDRVIADHFVQMLPESFVSDSRGRRYLLNVARKAKEAVCSKADSFSEVLITPDGEEWQAELSILKLNSLLSPFVEKITQVCQDVLSDASLQASDIDTVVLVGGSTRVPLIKQCVADMFQCDPHDETDPEQVVAVGAAIQADILSGNGSVRDDLLLLDVIPLSLGVETMGGLVEKIIPRNSTIPIMKSQEFTTAKEGQSAISFHIVQGERDTVSDCRSLAHFELKGLPPRVAGAVRVKVSFRVDADGLLVVEAQEADTGVATTVEVKPTYGLSDDEVTRMIQDAAEHAEEDMHKRRYKEKQVDAQRVIDSLNSALSEDGDELLNASEAAVILAAKEVLEKRMVGGDYEALDSAIKELEACSEFYVERRMNKSIQSALCGLAANEIKR